MSNFNTSYKNELFLQPKVDQYGSHMVMSNVHKETKNKYVNIDTRFREDYDEYSKITQTYFNILLPDKITNVKSISVVSIEIPIFYNNISASLENNIFNIKNTSSHNIIIPDENYDNTSSTTLVNTQTGVTGDSIYNIVNNKTILSFNTNSYSLVRAVNNKLLSEGLNSDLSYNITENHSVIKNTSNTTTYTIDFAVDKYGNFDKYNIKSKLGWLMGYRLPSYVIAPLTNLVSESIVDLNGPRYLYLIVDEFSKGNQTSFISPLYSSLINKNILARIAVNTNIYPYGKILVANKYDGYLVSDKRSYSGKIDMQRLNIQLVNELGFPVNLNGADFSFVLEVEHE